MGKEKEIRENRTLFNLRRDLEILTEEIRNDVSGPVIASFGFIIALIWRDAIQSAINTFLRRAGLVENAYIYQFVSAIIVTILVIAIMIFVTKIFRKRKKKRIEKEVRKIKNSEFD